jgi:hypothetical protein
MGHGLAQGATWPWRLAVSVKPFGVALAAEFDTKLCQALFSRKEVEIDKPTNLQRPLRKA